MNDVNDHLCASGLVAPLRSALRARDLVPGGVYLSPTGRRCMLLQPAGSSLANVSYMFAYLTRNGGPAREEGFALNSANARAIAALREVQS